MMHHFNANRLLYYNKMIISVEQMKIMRIFVFEIELKKINTHFILLPENDRVDEYTSPFRQM